MNARRVALWVLLACLVAAPVAAQEVFYVTDQLRITVRSGPSLTNKVVAMAATGEQLTLLGQETDGWALVRLPGGKEGWVLTRFMTKERPARLRLAELDPANKDMAHSLEQLHSDNRRLEGELSGTESKLADLTARYDKLQADAADVLALKKRHQKLKAQYEQQNKELKELVVENKSMKFSSNLKWFLAGAGVLVVGWLMGLALHRRKKRWNPSIY
ncbi:MAG: TIGR04211 family SH3 domain-containing protein [Desulfarculaceae bacterium]|nr:TIGR04211 family SH3 domain-containing protein [Desulfarculaceae bacterium]MCF8070886.1 TIGR04211 family SH3 domain-containing protein [Desulfarculaceae bacterium]MCF8100474.1 TIGR04211 family SH3 domain-containing protein [Desulfarculaceae bacterium]MCF8118211.1 TIGR04211 family SH3 domain-containing protein [Desulfarculaceae bacterium]